MTVDECYKIILYCTAKNDSQGYVSPADFNRVINIGQRSYISFLLGSFQQYSPGRPVAKVELGQNSVIRQRLSPAIYGYVLNIDAQGNAPYPGDYLQTDSMYSIYGVKRIRNVQQNTLDANYNSVIDPITNNPIYLIQDINFQFYPTNTGQAKMTYVKQPPDIIWSYTLDTNGRPVYDAVNSVQPIFDDMTMFEIISRALLIIGVNLMSNTIMGFSKEIKTEGV